MAEGASTVGLVRGFSLNFAFNLGGTALSSLSTLVVVRALAPDTWGVAAATLGVGQLLGSLISFGSQTEHVRRYARLEFEQACDAAIRDSSARVTVAVGALCMGVLLLIVLGAGGAAVICAAGTFTSLGTTNYFISRRRFVAAGLLLLLEKGTALAGVTTLALLGFVTSITLPTIFGLAGVVVGIVSWAAQLRVGGQRASAPRWVDLIGHWRGTLYFGLTSMAPSFLLLDSTIVALFSDPRQGGYFSVASKLVAPLSIAATSIVAALLPYMSTSHSRRFPSWNWRKAVPLSGALMLAIAFLLASAYWWVPLLFGDAYRDSVWPVRFYLANVLVVVATRALSTILQAWNDERIVACLVLAQVILAITGIATGAAFGGALWASISVLATNVLLAIALLLRVAVLKDPRLTSI